jgi:glyoxylase-like metal-dependent hydrolase (beta-lactamase superfamily II)/rhodanese-related sulfurtransferase
MRPAAIAESKRASRINPVTSGGATVIIEQFFVEGLAHSSYLVSGESSCVVVDPRRDARIYLDAAGRAGKKITHVLETHLHADFVSGHLDLAALTGAEIVVPAAAGCRFAHRPAAGGDSFAFEDMTFTVLDTPGHTPEHVSFALSDRSRGPEPAAVFCGDTLFIGDVGRPDLFPGQAEKLAAQLFESLHEKLLKLPDGCLVCPAHGAGSLCGRSIGAMRLGTIGYERRHNQPLQISDRAAFILSLTTDMPPAPDHFSRCSEINGRGPALLENLPDPSPLAPEEFDARREQGALVLDTRGHGCFGGAHVPGSLFIGLGGNFATYAGWLLPSDRDILLVADGPEAASETVTQLRRVGIDRAVGYLAGGTFAWAGSGRSVEGLAQVSGAALNDLLTGHEPLQLVDVRSPGEFAAYHIAGAVNIPAPDLREAHRRLDPALKTVLLCSSGQRSTTGASILARHGFGRLLNASGGMNGFNAAGFARKCPVCTIPHGPRWPVR